jgi:hypothetical protein
LRESVSSLSSNAAIESGKNVRPSQPISQGSLKMAKCQMLFVSAPRVSFKKDVQTGMRVAAHF